MSVSASTRDDVNDDESGPALPVLSTKQYPNKYQAPAREIDQDDEAAGVGGGGSGSPQQQQQQQQRQPKLATRKKQSMDALFDIPNGLGALAG